MIIGAGDHVAQMQYECQNESLKLIWPYLLEIESRFGINKEKQKNCSLEVYYTLAHIISHPGAEDTGESKLA